MVELNLICYAKGSSSAPSSTQTAEEPLYGGTPSLMDCPKPTSALTVGRPSLRPLPRPSSCALLTCSETWFSWKKATASRQAKPLGYSLQDPVARCLEGRQGQPDKTRHGHLRLPISNHGLSSYLSSYYSSLQIS